ncbi:hypothetical protein vBVpaMR16F_107 [Vibrio phage vB_VpaM_R16F]|nr:hypothetical protein vBVpaMR16F_107 [Vibrio phage vB_VpaM_R16F]
MATTLEIPLFKDSIEGLKINVGTMLDQTFPDHKILFANSDIVAPSQKAIVLKRNVRSGNPNGLNLVPIRVHIDALTGEKHYIYQATASYRVKFHKTAAIDEAYYLKMLLSTDEFHYTWWGSNDLYGITNISDVADDPVSVDFVEWEEGAIMTFDCTYLFRHTESDAKTIERILFTSNNGSGVLSGESENFWITLGYSSYQDYVDNVNTLYFHVNGDDNTPSGVDFSQDW